MYFVKELTIKSAFYNIGNYYYVGKNSVSPIITIENTNVEHILGNNYTEDDYFSGVSAQSSNNVDIKFTTGILSIKIDKNNSIFMKGPVSNIEEIKVNL